MTIRALDGTHEQPVPADRRNQAVLSPMQAAELASLGVVKWRKFPKRQPKCGGGALCVTRLATAALARALSCRRTGL
jgi:hypothetical protein